MKFVEKWVELGNILNEATKPIKTRTVSYFCEAYHGIIAYIYIMVFMQRQVPVPMKTLRARGVYYQLLVCIYPREGEGMRECCPQSMALCESASLVAYTGPFFI